MLPTQVAIALERCYTVDKNSFVTLVSAVVRAC